MVVVHHLGFKLVSADRVCVDRSELEMLRRAYCRMVQNQQAADKLFGDDE